MNFELYNDGGFSIIFFLIFPCLISYFIIPFIKKIAYKFIIVDKPNHRKLHSKPIPNIGGISIALSFSITILILKNFTNIKFENFNIIFISSLIIMLIGLLDDIYSLSAIFRLSFQILITSLIWSKGINISILNLSYLGVDLDYIQIPKIISLIITCFWVVGVINAINWIDGLNGLACGVIIIILFGTASIALSKNLLDLLLVSLILIGSCLGFLIQNLKPNNIIMGDNGSNFLGFNLAIFCLYAASNQSANLFSSKFAIFPIIPFALVGFPIIDMTNVISKRILNNSSPFLPDKNHFHHLLLDKGFSNKGVIFTIYSSTLYFVSLSFLFTDISYKIPLFIISNFLLIFIFVLYFKMQTN